MPRTQEANLLRHLRQLGTAHRFGHENDRQLLQQFLAARDEAAFAALVQRHGPMVLGVCRSVLRHQQDAEDAFQATFLVLVRQAGTIRRQASVRSWLHGVAYRLAVKAKMQAARRRARSATAVRSPAPEPLEELSVRAWQTILHEELQRLPGKYRAALLLCYWEGKTRDEAADYLGVARGTLRDQLERARRLLRSRLVRRGVTPSAALFTTLFAHSTGQALAPSLATTTIQAASAFAGKTTPAAPVSAALTLAEGALRTMRIRNWTMAILVALLLSSLAAGLGLLASTPGADPVTTSKAGLPLDEANQNKPTPGQHKVNQDEPKKVTLPESAGKPGKQTPPGPDDPVPKEKNWKAGETLQIGGKKYQLKFISEHPPEIAWMGTDRTEQVALWTKNKLHIIDPFCPKWQEPIPCSWPVLGVSADQSRAVVQLTKKKFGEYHIGVADLKKNVLLADFLLSHLEVGMYFVGDNWEVSPWAFSEGGRWLLPMNGMGKEYVFFDVKEKKIHRHNFFGKEKKAWQYWWGAVLEGKEVVLLIRDDAGSNGRVHIPLADPTKLKFVPGGPHGLIFKQEGKKLLLAVPAKGYAWLDSTTWQLGPLLKDKTQQELLLGRADPKGRWIYYGVINIYDAKTGKLVAKGPPHDGGRANAFSLGVTFNSSGDVAAYATPYESRLTFLDTNTHKTLARAHLDSPISGAFLFDPPNADQPGSCLAVPVFLPYEK